MIGYKYCLKKNFERPSEKPAELLLKTTFKKIKYSKKVLWSKI